MPRAGPELVALQPGGGLGGPRSQAGVDRGAAGLHAFELSDEFVAADALEQVPGCADPHGLKGVLLVVVDRQQDHLLARVAFANLPAQVQSADPLHPHIAQHDVRPQIADHRQCPVGADGHPHHRDPFGERREHRLETLDHHLVVVDQDDPHGRGCGHGFTVVGAGGGSPLLPSPERGM